MLLLMLNNLPSFDHVRNTSESATLSLISHIATLALARYNAPMFDDALDLSDVLARLKRADESLAEFVAPLWPGVVMAAAWIEGKPRLFRLPDVPAAEGYYSLTIDEHTATVVRAAENHEIKSFLNYLGKASVILLDGGLAYPAGSVERLQGITAPRPIHFAPDTLLARVQARFDGLNLFYDSAAKGGNKSDDPFAELLGMPAADGLDDDLFGLLGDDDGDASAQKALDRLHEDPQRYDEARLTAVVETAGAVLSSWSKEPDGYAVRWRREDAVHDIRLAHAAAPITSGISLAGARARSFDPATLVRELHQHILDAWMG